MISDVKSELRKIPGTIYSVILSQDDKQQTASHWKLIIYLGKRKDAEINIEDLYPRLILKALIKFLEDQQIRYVETAIYVLAKKLCDDIAARQDQHISEDLTQDVEKPSVLESTQSAGDQTKEAILHEGESISPLKLYNFLETNFSKLNSQILSMNKRINELNAKLESITSWETGNSTKQQVTKKSSIADLVELARKKENRHGHKEKQKKREALYQTNIIKKKIVSNTLDDAEELVRRSLKQAPTKTSNVIFLAEILLKQGKIDETIQWCRKQLETEKFKQNTDLMTFLAIAFSNDGKHNKALDILEQALKIKPTNHRIHLELSRVYQELGRDKKSKSALNKATSLLTSKMTKDAS